MAPESKPDAPARIVFEAKRKIDAMLFNSILPARSPTPAEFLKCAEKSTQDDDSHKRCKWPDNGNRKDVQVRILVRQFAYG